MESWSTFSNPNLPITLRYPDPTPQGFTVQILEISTSTSYRAHLTSDGSDEIYFEVGRYTNTPVHQAIETFVQDVKERIQGVRTGAVEAFTFASFPAYRFSIRWPGKERRILFVESSGELYRIIYDPASPINAEILASFAFQAGR